MTKTALVILSEILQGIHEVKHIATALKELEDAKPSRIPDKAIQEHNISGIDILRIPSASFPPPALIPSLKTLTMSVQSVFIRVSGFNLCVCSSIDPECLISP